MHMQANLLFLTLNVFSATGGIEKVARLAGMALGELSAEEQGAFTLYSAYDKTTDCDPKYIQPAAFRGFGGNRLAFIWQSIRRGRKASIVLLSHSNLLPVGYAIKLLSPATKLVLFAHGIEVWPEAAAWKRHMLKRCDRILAVSRFTCDTMLQVHGLQAAKLTVLNNCIDPFLPPLHVGKKPELLERYGFTAEDKILLTLTRLSAKERYKGYDEVLMAVKALESSHPDLRYLIVGKADREERERLERFIRQQGLQNRVVLAGFVPDSELPAHFALADTFIMPSRKEGFGIVFIEALYYGLPVIAGNSDGSVDALGGGAFGLLVNPTNGVEIRRAIQKMLAGGTSGAPARDAVLEQFGFPVYKKALWKALRSFLQVEKEDTGKIEFHKPIHPKPKTTRTKEGTT